jgi:hypothetical protein
LADAFPEQLITRRVDGRIRTFPWGFCHFFVATVESIQSL